MQLKTKPISPPPALSVSWATKNKRAHSVVTHLITSWRKKNVLALSLVLSRPTSALLQSHPNIAPAFCLELIYRVTTQPSGSSQKPQHGLTCLAAKAHPTSIFGLNLPQFGLNARCLFDISAAVATLRSHLGSCGQNPRSDGWLDGCPAESSRA